MKISAGFRPWNLSFSALQRAENSSTWHVKRLLDRSQRFSALQRAENSSRPATAGSSACGRRVSVLFSEPKIPQLTVADYEFSTFERFSALQRAENSSRVGRAGEGAYRRSVSVLFSEPKIPPA